MPSSPEIVSHTKSWLNNFIIEHNICPFAKREFDKGDKGGIHYEVVISDKLENQLQELIYSCEQLDKETDIENGLETSLLILPNGLSNFDEYLDFLDLANELMHKQGYEGVYQLASFHPQYCFNGVEADDASNYTNRSPYPMLHLIREASLEKVLAHYPNPEDIPARNIGYTREMGQDSLQKLFQGCLK